MRLRRALHLTGPVRRGGTAVVAVGYLIVLTLDGVFPLWGRITSLVLGLSAALVVPWAVLLFQRPVGIAVPVAGPRPTPQGRRRRALLRALLRGFLLAGVLALLAARWTVLVRSQGTASAYLVAARSYTLALGLLLALGLAQHELRASRLVARVSAQPARLMAASFGATGLLGALLLSLPVSHRDVAAVSLLDSVFMAFSAVCVTGLAVHNVAATYSFFGQVVLCLLVQVGGLGIMVLSAAVAMLVGQRLQVRERAMLMEVVDGASLASLRRTVVTLCAYTFGLEALGALALFLQLRGTAEVVGVPGGAAWAAVFHAVSAFCNAGFSVLPGGLVALREAPGPLGVVASLVVCGGLGFPVLDELGRALWWRLRGRRLPTLSLHTRVVLGMSGPLLVVVALAYLLLEWAYGFRALSVQARFAVALFQSASTRSAGFNAVELATLRPATLALTCVAMMIGAAPGSTGGGLKVTTVAALFAGLRAELRGAEASLLDRSLPAVVIRKATGVVFLGGAIVSGAFFVLLLLEPQGPLDLLFEAVSAFTTAGLSTGVTPRLGAPGRLLVAALMLTGRIGPLTLALALSRSARRAPLRRPEERILIG